MKSIVPIAGLLEHVIPESYEAVTRMNPGAVFLFIFFLSVTGPATVYVITRYRISDPDKDKGATTLAVLQVMCYLSWLFLALYLPVGLATNPTQTRVFVNLCLVIVLPGTFANVAFMDFMDALRREWLSRWTKRDSARGQGVDERFV